MEAWMIYFIIKWGMFFFIPICFGRWIILSNWKYTETSFKESKIVYDYFKDKELEERKERLFERKIRRIYNQESVRYN